MDTTQSMERNDVEMKSVFDFRQLEAAAERVIALGRSMANRLLALERDVQKRERDTARLKTQISTLGQFVVANFPEVLEDDHAYEESSVSATLRLLEELKKRREASPPHGDEQ